MKCRIILSKMYYFKIGLCNTDTKSGVFRRKSSSARNRLAPIQSSTSCPTSPRQGLRSISSDGALRKLDHSMTSTSLAADAILNDVHSNTMLHRSASTVSNYRPRSSPSGLFSYTGKFMYHFWNAQLK